MFLKLKISKAKVTITKINVSHFNVTYKSSTNGFLWTELNMDGTSKEIIEYFENQTKPNMFSLLFSDQEQ